MQAYVQNRIKLLSCKQNDVVVVNEIRNFVKLEFKERTVDNLPYFYNSIRAGFCFATIWLGTASDIIYLLKYILELVVLWRTLEQTDHQHFPAPLLRMKNMP